MTIQLERIEKTLAALAAYGVLPEGGTTRLSYGPEYLAAQEFLRGEMTSAGMQVELDPIGNLIGTYAGREPGLPAVMSGSHLDTVPAGGNFDGALGIVAALECARSWQDEGYRPRRSLQVIATIEEEGTAFGMACFGVRVRSGEFKTQQPQEITYLAGGTLADCLQRAELPQQALQLAATGFADVAAFVELHIEQGAELDQQGVACGIVEAIVGYDRLFVTLQGEANHAGTTSMARRRDALAAAASLVLGVKDLAEHDKRFVATIGQLTVVPNVVNIVPGQVRLSIETRSYNDAILAEVRAQVLELLRRVEAESGVTITQSHNFHVAAVPLMPGIAAIAEQAAAQCGVDCLRLPSWAGHDAQIFAAAGVPTGMIFVPSIGGISHAREESSDYQAVGHAVRVLEQTLRTLAEA